MLSAATIATVKSTAPALAEEGEAITTLFYHRLFADHPELQHIFNMANQVDGAQSRALAESVFLYASHIDALQNLGPLVSRIAHKHASLQVAPEHYPIVGTYLLAAIRDHLKLEEGHPVLQAWAEAYAHLAAIFVEAEAGIYENNALKPGGWTGFRPFFIRDVVPEARGIRSFYLVPQDGQAIAAFLPGQYLGLKVRPEGRDYDEIRQYSLSNAPGHDHYRITVKREDSPAQPPGAVSAHLHDAQAGDVVWLQPPGGDFTLRTNDSNPVLIAGGVGITPLLSMLLHLLESGADVSRLVFIQCCRDAEHQLMGDTLRSLSATHGFSYRVSYESGAGGDHEGRLDTAVLERWIPGRDGDVYFCGPKPFMAAINTSLLDMGFADAQLHYEVFGPSTRLPAR